MSWDHKAYAFDWVAFEANLKPILDPALKTNKGKELLAFIEKNRKLLSDPNEGGPLAGGWRKLVQADDVQALGDIALTRFYDPSKNCGLDGDWSDLEEILARTAQKAFLGQKVGPKGNEFDPGRMGAYFQAPDQVKKSLAVVNKLDNPELEDFDSVEEFRSLLEFCVSKKLGLYITF